MSPIDFLSLDYITDVVLDLKHWLDLTDPFHRLPTLCRAQFYEPWWSNGSMSNAMDSFAHLSNALSLNFWWLMMVDPGFISRYDIVQEIIAFSASSWKALVVIWSIGLFPFSSEFRLKKFVRPSKNSMITRYLKRRGPAHASIWSSLSIELFTVQHGRRLTADEMDLWDLMDILNQEQHLWCNLGIKNQLEALLSIQPSF